MKTQIQGGLGGLLLKTKQMRWKTVLTLLLSPLFLPFHQYQFQPPLFPPFLPLFLPQLPQFLRRWKGEKKKRRRKKKKEVFLPSQARRTSPLRLRQEELHKIPFCVESSPTNFSSLVASPFLSGFCLAVSTALVSSISQPPFFRNFPVAEKARTCAELIWPCASCRPTRKGPRLLIS